MKSITTRIPDKSNKKEYALIHRSTYATLVHYIEEVDRWVEAGGLEDWKSEIHNELQRIRQV